MGQTFSMIKGPLGLFQHRSGMDRKHIPKAVSIKFILGHSGTRLCLGLWEPLLKLPSVLFHLNFKQVLG